MQSWNDWYHLFGTRHPQLYFGPGTIDFVSPQPTGMVSNRIF